MSHNPIAVKKLFAWGLVFLCALQAFGQSNVLMQLSEANASPTTNRPITIQATSPFSGNKVFIYSDSNGNALYNFNPGVLYNCQITAPPQAINFQIYIPTGTVGTAIDWTNFWGIGGGIATYPAGAVAPSIAMADARYLMSGTSLTNLYYPLTNPNGFVSNSVLLAASNGIIALIPSTAGLSTSNFVTNAISIATNGLDSFAGRTNQVGNSTNNIGLQSGLMAFVPTNSYSTYQAMTNSQIQGTNGLGSMAFQPTNIWDTFSGRTNQVGQSTNGIGISSGLLAFQPTNNYSTYQNSTNLQIQGTNGIGISSGLMAFQPTNNYATYQSLTNGQFQVTNGLGSMAFQNTNAWDTFSGRTNAIGSSTNSIGIGSGLLAFQPTNSYSTYQNSTNLQIQSTNAIGLASGLLAFVPTNNYSTYQAMTNAQIQGTNNLGGMAFQPTNVWDTLNGRTNQVGNATNNIGISSGLMAFQPTNQWATTGAVGIAYSILTPTNSYSFGTNWLYTNMASGNIFNTNYANTNASSLYGQSTNFATTNISSVYVASTNGSATGLTLQGNLNFGTKLIASFNTNDFGIDGPCGSPFVVGTYRTVPFGSVWTNFYYPSQTIVLSGSTLLIQSNTTTLYTSANGGQTWSVVSPGIAPAPTGHYGHDVFRNGTVFLGWNDDSNMLAQINGATVGGVVQGILSNEFFSAAGTNVIANLIAQLAGTNSGASLIQVTNVINSFQFVSSNGATGNGQQVYSTNTGLGWFWAAASSGGGGGSTNGLASTNFVITYIQTTSNALQAEISAGGIATLNGLGTNTSLTNFNYLAGTNIYSATNRSVVASATTGFFTNLNSINQWSSNSTSTNIFSQSGYIGNEQDTNLTVINDAWLGGSNMLIYYIPAQALIPIMTTSNAPYGLASCNTSAIPNMAFQAFNGPGGGYWQNANGNASNSYVQYQFPSPVTVNESIVDYVIDSGVFNTNVAYLLTSSDGSTWTTNVTYFGIAPESFYTNYFANVTASYFRWQFNGFGVEEVKGAQVLFQPINIVSNSITMEILSTNGGVTINTNLSNGNALEVLGNIDSTSSSTPNATDTIATIGTATEATNNSSFSYSQTFLADSVSANTVNAGGFSVNGVPVYFPSNAASQFEYFVTNASATNQFLDPNNFNGIYQFIGVKTSGGWTVNVYSNLNGTATNFLLSGAVTASSATNVYNFLALTNGFTGSGVLFSPPVYIRAGSPVGVYIPENNTTPMGNPIISIYNYSNNVSSLPYLASGPGGNYDAGLVTNISNLAIANSGAITNNEIGSFNIGTNGTVNISSNLTIQGIPTFPVNSNSLVFATNSSAIGLRIYGSTGLTNWTDFGPSLDSRTNSGTATSETIGGSGLTLNTSNLISSAKYGIQSNAATIYSDTNVLTLYTNGTLFLNAVGILNSNSPINATNLTGTAAISVQLGSQTLLPSPLVGVSPLEPFLLGNAGGSILGVVSGVGVSNGMDIFADGRGITNINVSNISTNGQVGATAGSVVTMRPDGTLWLTNSPSVASFSTNQPGVLNLTNTATSIDGNILLTLGTSNGVLGSAGTVGIGNGGWDTSGASNWGVTYFQGSTQSTNGDVAFDLLPAWVTGQTRTTTNTVHFDPCYFFNPANQTGIWGTFGITRLFGGVPSVEVGGVANGFAIPQIVVDPNNGGINFGGSGFASYTQVPGAYGGYGGVIPNSGGYFFDNGSSLSFVAGFGATGPVGFYAFDANTVAWCASVYTNDIQHVLNLVPQGTNNLWANHFNVPIVQAGATNAVLVAATSVVIPLTHPMYSTNYVPYLTVNGTAISVTGYTALTTNSFTANMATLTFTGPLLWTVTSFTQ